MHYSTSPIIVANKYKLVAVLRNNEMIKFSDPAMTVSAIGEQNRWFKIEEIFRKLKGKYDFNKMGIDNTKYNDIEQSHERGCL